MSQRAAMHRYETGCHRLTGPFWRSAALQQARPAFRQSCSSRAGAHTLPPPGRGRHLVPKPPQAVLRLAAPPRTPRAARPAARSRPGRRARLVVGQHALVQRAAPRAARSALLRLHARLVHRLRARPALSHITKQALLPTLNLFRTKAAGGAPRCGPAGAVHMPSAACNRS